MKIKTYGLRLSPQRHKAHRVRTETTIIKIIVKPNPIKKWLSVAHLRK
jgi:hypothetical protein